MTASQSMHRGMPDYMMTTQANTTQDFSFTRGASDRNEQRLLARFIRLADLLVLNALREVGRDLCIKSPLLSAHHHPHGSGAVTVSMLSRCLLHLLGVAEVGRGMELSCIWQSTKPLHQLLSASCRHSCHHQGCPVMPE